MSQKFVLLLLALAACVPSVDPDEIPPAEEEQPSDDLEQPPAEAPIDAMPDAATPDAATPVDEPPDTTAPDAATPVDEEPTDPEEEEPAPPAKAEVGHACTDHDSCSLGVCAQWEDNDDPYFNRAYMRGYCTGSCTTDEDCGPSGKCASKRCERTCLTTQDCGREDYYCEEWGYCEAGTPVTVDLRAFVPGVTSVTLTETASGQAVTLTASGKGIAGYFQSWGAVNFTATTNGISVPCRFLQGQAKDQYLVGSDPNFVIACGVSDISKACTSQADCAVHCDADQDGGYCTGACTQAADCGQTDAVCEGQRCVKTCTSHADCGDARLLCNTSGRCRPGRKISGLVHVLSEDATLTISDANGGTITRGPGGGTGRFELPELLRLETPYDLTVTTDKADVRCTVLRGSGPSVPTDVWISCGRQEWFTEPGTSQFVVPPGVTKVHVVAVGAGGGLFRYAGGGGGELCYANDVSVAGHASIPVVIGAAGSEASTTFLNLSAAAGKNAKQGCFVYQCTEPPIPGAGGTGGSFGTCFPGGSGGYNSGGGGAGGYAGAGGNGPNYNNAPLFGTNGAGGAGAGGFERPGGCVGLEGQGADGIAGNSMNQYNDGSSGPYVPCVGAGLGYAGGVRIIWERVPEEPRSYPNNAASK